MPFERGVERKACKSWGLTTRGLVAMPFEAGGDRKGNALRALEPAGHVSMPFERALIGKLSGLSGSCRAGKTRFYALRAGVDRKAFSVFVPAELLFRCPLRRIMVCVVSARGLAGPRRGVVLWTCGNGSRRNRGFGSVGMGCGYGLVSGPGGCRRFLRYP